jgi:hypothetical protein
MLTRNRISLLLAIAFFVSLVAVIATTLSSGQTTVSANQRIKVLRRKVQLHVKPTADEIASAKNQLPKEERELEDKLPKHLPLKIKLRAEKEAGFRDLKNDLWQKDFELEVTNTSAKPIYFLELWLVFPDVISENGRQVGVPLRYGRMDFVHLSTLALPTDVPIPAGGTYVFKIPERDQRGWEWHKTREKRQGPRKVDIKFVQLSFGDGTGFNGTDAKPYPYRRDRSSTGPCREGPAQVDAKGESVVAQYLSLPSFKSHSFQ